MKDKLQTKQKGNSGGRLNKVAARSFSRRAFLKGALATAPLLFVGPSPLRPKVAGIVPWQGGKRKSTKAQMVS